MYNTKTLEAAKIERLSSELEDAYECIKQLVAIAEVLSGCVEYDYGGNVIGDEEAQAIAALDTLLEEGKHYETQE